MGTKVQYKTLPGHYPVGDLNDDPNSGTWPVYYGEKSLSNGQFNDPYTPKTVADAYFGYHTETVKQKMLEHEEIFKSQLYELHRLYRVQRDLMDEMKMNELHKQSMALETSMSSCSAPQRQDAQRWHTSSAFLMSSFSSAKPSILGGKDFNSRPTFLSGKSQQNSLVSPSNVGSSKDCEVEILECRPSKARKKVFDLELRADEYIDEEEPRVLLKEPSSQPYYASKGICDEPRSSSSKLFLGGAVKIDSRVDGPRNGLADLNEQIQESNSSSVSVDGCDSNIRPSIGPTRFISEPQLHTIPRQFMQNSQHGRDDGRSRDSVTGLKENGREWLPMLDSAQKKLQTTTFSSKLPQQINLFSPPYCRTDQRKGMYWNGRPETVANHSGGGLDFFNRLGNSHQPDRPISHLMATWEKTGSCVTQNSITADMQPFYNSATTLPQSSQSSNRRSGNTGAASQTKSGFGRDITYRNGFYTGSCSGSGSAQFPNTVSEYPHRANGHVASDVRLCQNGSKNLNSLNCVDARATKGIDLNALSTIDDDEAVQNPILLQGSTQDHVASLPWLKSSTGLRNGIISSNNLIRQTNGSGSTVCDVETKLTTKKILGVPNFGESQFSKDGSSCRSTLSKAEEVCTTRLRGFDMNLPCESEEKATENIVVSQKNHIDLNMCISEDDMMVTALTPGGHPKTYRGFDLEAPGEIDEEDISPMTQRSEQLEKDIEAAAAEAVVGISHCKELTLLESPARKSSDPKPQTLQWFAEAIASCSDDADQMLQDTTRNSVEDSDASDYFEYMTLQLPETKEEDYLPDYPKPPEPEELTGAGAAFTTRTRKGQARRGRPRRDFQRDILPGLTSLARHEVTEDLQTFGGLMRAMGHSWQSSLTRRAGPRRGRPRLTPVQPPAPPATPTPVCSPLPPKRSISEASPSPVCTPSPQKGTNNELIIMEDHRSLTGWGKTTRRPRRQRCPSGNASVLHIA